MSPFISDADAGEYTLAGDSFIQSLSAGSITDLNGTPYLCTHGKDTAVTVYSYSESNYLYISNRAVNGNGLVISIALQSGDRIVVKGRTCPNWSAVEPRAWSAMFLNTNVIDWRPHKEWEAIWWEPDKSSNPFTLSYTITPKDVPFIINGGGIGINSLGSIDSLSIRPEDLSYFVDSIVLKTSAPRELVTLNVPNT